AQISAGWLIGRFGSRAVTTVLALLFCLAAFLPGQANSLPTLMGALFLFGAFNGGLDVAMNAQAALVEGAYGRPIMASFHGLWSVGGLLGAAVGGLIASWRIEVTPHLVSAGVLAFILMVVATRGLLPDTGRHTESGPTFALPPRVLLPMGAIAFAVLFCEGAVADWSAVYLRDTLQSTPGVAAAGYAGFALLMAGGRLTGDWLTVQLGAMRLVRGGGALVVLGIGLIVWASVPWVAIIGFGLIGAGVSCIFPLILSAAARTPGVVPGTAIAAMATAGYSGFLVGPPLIGLAAEATSLRLALLFLGIFGLLILLFGGTVGQQNPNAHKQGKVTGMIL
ncbi:MAG: MFS transporter, partial [Caldilineaceae bacterium]|nr:MFS transporter [Caldilineaceae bacterium]